MDIKTNRDFASFLDDLAPARVDFLDEGEQELEQSFESAPAIPFDYLSVADELHSGRITVAPDRRNLRQADPYRAELEAYLDAAAPLIESRPLSAEMLPSIEPRDIATELDLDHADASDMTRIRRRFAFANHPDRVEPHLRDRAMVRMQLANMMIDDAQSRLAISGR